MRTTSLLLCAYMSGAAAQLPERMLVEQVAIAGDKNDYSFIQVNQVLPHADGGITVLDRAEGTVHRFDRTGRFVVTIGRERTGFGRFQHSVLGLLDDTVYAFNIVEGTLTYIGRGKVLREVRVEPLRVSTLAQPLRPLRLLPGGRSLWLPTSTRGEAEVGRADSLDLSIVALDSEGPRVLATMGLRGGEVLVVPRPGGSPLTIAGGLLPELARRGPLWSVSQSGNLVLVEADHVGRRFTVMSLAFNGDTAFRSSFGYEPREVSKALLDSLIGIAAKRMRGVPPRRAESLVRDQVGPVRFFPPVSRVIPGVDGSVWLAREPAVSPSREWLVLDERGAVLFTTRTGSGVRVLAASNQWLWGATQDSSGVTTVRKFLVR